MKKTVFKSVVVLSVVLLAVLSMNSCQLGGYDASVSLQDIAESALVYDASRSIETASADVTEHSESPSLDAISRAYDDYASGTKTEEDLGDGRIKITKTWTSWNGIAMKSEVIRLQKPEVTDNNWDVDGKIVDSAATETLYAGDLVNPVSTAQLTITWRKTYDNNVYMFSMLKQGERIKANGDFVRTYTEWDNLKRIVAKRVEYLRIGATVAEKTIRYTYTYLNENTIPDEIRFTVDGVEGYGLVLHISDPRILELYKDRNEDGLDEKCMRIERERDYTTGEYVTTRIRYNADGTEQSRVTVRARIRVVNGEVTLVRTLPNGDTLNITIIETADGYNIDRNGEFYTVTVKDDGSLIIINNTGAWQAVPGADGSWEITQL